MALLIEKLRLRGKITCLRFHSWLEADVGQEPSFLVTWFNKQSFLYPVTFLHAYPNEEGNTSWDIELPNPCYCRNLLKAIYQKILIGNAYLLFLDRVCFPP